MAKKLSPTKSKNDGQQTEETDHNDPSSLTISQNPLLTKILGAVVLVLLLVIVGYGLYSLGQSSKEKIPNPTPTPSATLSATPMIELSQTPTIEDIPSWYPTITNTPTNSPTGTPANTPTNSPTNTPTNSPTNTPSPTPIQQADLYISEYSFNHAPVMGQPFTVRIGLYNKGNLNAQAFWWEWWATSAVRPCRVRVGGGIVAHGGIIVNCTYTYGGWSTYSTKAVVDSDNEIAESDETNNTYTQTVIPIH